MAETKLGKDAITLPIGTTAQRPANPEVGMMRFNTDQGSVEWYDDVFDGWVPISKPPPLAAVGGTVTDIEQDGKKFRVHTFTSSGTFDVTRGGEVEYLVVAGGGGSGQFGTSTRGSGGGGAGGLLQGVINVIPQNYGIIVGPGGSIAEVGGNSSAFGFTSIGGGNSPSSNDGGISGGSGGGASGSTGASGGSGTPGQGNNGGASRVATSAEGGGGGGAGEPGQTRGKGGDGISSNITGNTLFYAGGGGAGRTDLGVGGIGGGGDGGMVVGSTKGQDGAPNTGGGAGGGDGNVGDMQGSSGGSGIVIVRYRIG